MVEIQIFDITVSRRSDKKWVDTKGSSDTVFIHGKASNGDTVLVRVQDYRPYVYVQLRPGRTDEVKEIKRRLMAKHVGVSFQLCRARQSRGYVPNQENCTSLEPRLFLFLKVYASSQRELGECIKSITWDQEIAWAVLAVCEDKVSTVTKFLDDHAKVLKLGTWVRLLTYETVQGGDRVSSADVELEMCSGPSNFEEIGDKRQFELSIAPMRLLSFDIEAHSEHFPNFPNPQLKHDMVITIGFVVQAYTDYGQPGTMHREALCLKNAHTSKTPPPEPATDAEGGGENVVLRWHETEKELIDDFAKRVRELDPDIIVAYNSCGFDWNFLVKRAERVKATKLFSETSRLHSERATVQRDISGDGRCYHEDSHVRTIEMTGRVDIDVFKHIQRQGNRFRPPDNNFKLQTMAKHYLEGEGKEDLPHEVLHRHFRYGGYPELIEIARYCVQDCVLPLKLLHKLRILVELLQTARTCSTPIRDILHKGKTVLALNKFVLYSHQKNYVLTPAPPRSGSESEGKYEGAKVLEPKRGVYTAPVATLDFNSLYPSIMMAYGICHTTYLHPCYVPEMKRHHPEHVRAYEMSNGEVHHFVDTKDPGLLPGLMRDLMKDRNAVKEMMQHCDASQSQQRDLFRGWQLAIKILMNSFYGMTGTAFSLLSMKPISKTICSIGRGIIDETTRIVARTFTMEFLESSKRSLQDRPCSATANAMEVIYGDTDSVMIAMHDCSQEEALVVAEGIAVKINSHYAQIGRGDIKIALEHIYTIAYFWQKKKYMGLDGLDGTSIKKGIECVRSDLSKFVASAMEDVIEVLLRQDDKITRSLDILTHSYEQLLRRAQLDVIRYHFKHNSDTMGVKNAVEKWSLPPWASCGGLRHALEQAEDVTQACKQLTDAIHSIQPTEDFTISNQVNNRDYKNTSSHPHLVVIKKLRERKQDVPKAGMQVSYVIVCDTPGQKHGSIADKAEVPAYAVEEHKLLDYYYYANSLAKKMNDIFSIFGTEEQKQVGDFLKEQLQKFSPESPLFGQPSITSIFKSKDGNKRQRGIVQHPPRKKKPINKKPINKGTQLTLLELFASKKSA